MGLRLGLGLGLGEELGGGKGGGDAEAGGGGLGLVVVGVGVFVLCFVRGRFLDVIPIGVARAIDTTIRTRTSSRGGLPCWILPSRGSRTSR